MTAQTTVVPFTSSTVLRTGWELKCLRYNVLRHVCHNAELFDQSARDIFFYFASLPSKKARSIGANRGSGLTRPLLLPCLSPPPPPSLVKSRCYPSPLMCHAPGKCQPPRISPPVVKCQPPPRCTARVAAKYLGLLGQIPSFHSLAETTRKHCVWVDRSMNFVSMPVPDCLCWKLCAWDSVVRILHIRWIWHGQQRLSRSAWLSCTSAGSREVLIWCTRLALIHLQMKRNNSARLLSTRGPNNPTSLTYEASPFLPTEFGAHGEVETQKTGIRRAFLCTFQTFWLAPTNQTVQSCSGRNGQRAETIWCLKENSKFLLGSEWEHVSLFYIGLVPSLELKLWWSLNPTSSIWTRSSARFWMVRLSRGMCRAVFLQQPFANNGCSLHIEKQANQPRPTFFLSVKLNSCLSFYGVKLPAQIGGWKYIFFPSGWNY